MKNIATGTNVKSLLLVDVSNIFHCVASKFPKRKLSYSYLSEVVGKTVRSIVYGAQMGHEADKFIRRIESLGYEVKFKRPKTYGPNIRKADWDVGITVDAFRYFNRVDKLILCTGDGDFKPLVEYFTANGKDVIIYGCNISRDLKNTATVWEEITSEWLS